MSSYEIFVHDLIVPFRIGVREHEHKVPQRVRFTVTVRLSDTAPPTTEKIEDVMSYSTIVQGIRALAAGEHIELAETLAARVADLCLADPRAERAEVVVEKLDVLEQPATVGVRLVRTR